MKCLRQFLSKCGEPQGFGVVSKATDRTLSQPGTPRNYEAGCQKLKNKGLANPERLVVDSRVMSMQRKPKWTGCNDPLSQKTASSAASLE